MKRAALLGMAVVAFVALAFFNEKESKSAETIPPEPAGISLYR
jgi:hypothetical protein